MQLSPYKVGCSSLILDDAAINFYILISEEINNEGFSKFSTISIFQSDLKSMVELLRAGLAS